MAFFCPEKQRPAVLHHVKAGFSPFIGITGIFTPLSLQKSFLFSIPSQPSQICRRPASRPFSTQRQRSARERPPSTPTGSDFPGLLSVPAPVPFPFFFYLNHVRPWPGPPAWARDRADVFQTCVGHALLLPLLKNRFSPAVVVCTFAPGRTP